MSRISPQHQDGAHLKAAAAYVESQDFRDLATRLWEGSESDRQELANQVLNAALPIYFLLY